MIDIPIIDTHLHIWDPERLHYAWLADVPTIAGAHLPADYRRATEGLPIEKMVFLQCEVDAAQYEEEVAWVSEQAKEDPRIQGIVAWAPLEQGGPARDALTALCAQYPLLRGIRRLIQFEDDTEFCLRPDFIRGVQLLSEFNLSFDLCIKGDEQVKNTLRLVQKCPEVNFILDHIGNPFIKEGIMEPWAGYIRELAALPNTWCKISGVVTGADMDNWTPDDIRPYLDHVLGSFGFDRVAFGGDWPVVTLASNYRRWIETLWDAVSECTDGERRKLFYENAAAFYRV